MDKLFCIKDGKLHVAERDFASHCEWFRHERWMKGGSENDEDEDIDEGDEEEDRFFGHTTCGSYNPRENALHIFREGDFEPEPEPSSTVRDIIAETADIVERHLPHLVRILQLGGDTRIFIGSWGSELGGEHQHPHFLGTIKTLLKDEHKKENQAELLSR